MKLNPRSWNRRSARFSAGQGAATADNEFNWWARLRGRHGRDNRRQASVLTFQQAAYYHLTRTVRSHIAGLISPLPIRYRDGKGEFVDAPEPITAILGSLTPQLIAGFAPDAKMQGNGVLVKSRMPDGQLMGYQYISATRVSAIIRVEQQAFRLHGYRTTPKSNAGDFDYADDVRVRDGALERIGMHFVSNSLQQPYWTPEDVFHLRIGTDDRYGQLLGDNLLAHARAIADNDAKSIDHVMQILESLAKAGMILKFAQNPDSPHASASVEEVLDEIERIETALMGKRGAPVGTTWDVEAMEAVARVQNLMFDDTYKDPQFRFCAMFDTPCALVGLRAGMEESPWSNLATLRKYEYDTLIQPLADSLGAAFTNDIRCELEMRGIRFDGEIVFDTSGLSVIQPDIDAEIARAAELVRRGVINWETAQEKLREIGYLNKDQGGDPSPGGGSATVDREESG